jgi:hypothetical protein
MNDGCHGCQGCVARCTCLTGDPYECPKACGEGELDPGGAPPNEPPPVGGAGPGGEGGSGGGAPGGVGGTSPGGSGGTNDPPPAPGGGGTNNTTPCVYPPGPYGTTVGSVIAPTTTWQGYREDSATVSTIGIQDYFDCDGSKGINALLLTESAVWCGACQQEAEEMNGLMAGGWTQSGIRVLTLIIENGAGNPATIQTAKAWKDAFDAKGWAVAADPNFTFSSSGSNGLPLQIIVDPRSMKIVKMQEGAGSYGALTQLAQSNK